VGEGLGFGVYGVSQGLGSHGRQAARLRLAGGHRCPVLIFFSFFFLHVSSR